ncbi:MAG: ArsA family ATPase [Actinomycetota bacterium]
MPPDASPTNPVRDDAAGARGGGEVPGGGASWESAVATNVVIVAGKGGVGKTTVTAVLAHSAARAGRKVLVVELDGKPTLQTLVHDAGTNPKTIELTSISASDALDEYLRDHGFERVAKRLQRTGVIDIVGTAAPGIDDVVVLGKVKQLERSGDYDLVVVDGPAAGHAITFLSSASGLADAVRGGPVRAQSDDVMELLTDGDRCQVVLVTLPETTPMNEVIETAYALEDQVGVALGPIVVNDVDRGTRPPDAVDELIADQPSDVAQVLRAAAAFRRSRQDMEAREIERLAESLPLPRLLLPALPVAGIGASDIDRLVEAFTAGGRR